MSLVWNAKLKHCFPPEFRGRMHQTRPSALFSPIFSRSREKIGPSETRQKRPRRNEPPQATSLILCARFFLSKPQTEFAVWVFLYKSVTTSQSQLRRASFPGRGAKGFALPEVPIRGGIPGGRWIRLRGRLLRRGCRGDLRSFWPRTGPGWGRCGGRGRAPGPCRGSRSR